MNSANGSSSTALFLPVVKAFFPTTSESSYLLSKYGTYSYIDSQDNMLGRSLINSIKINRLPENLNFSKSESW